MQLGEDFKLTLPAKLVRAAGWEMKTEITSLVANLVADCSIRFHLPGDAIPRINSIREELRASESDAEYLVEALQVIDDRYQSLTFNLKDGRIRLTIPMLLHLGIEPRSQPYVFLQARQSTIDLMSLETRKKRLEKFKGVTSI